MPKETSAFDLGTSVCATYDHQVDKREPIGRLRACKALLFADFGGFDTGFLPRVVTAVAEKYDGVAAGLESMLSTEPLQEPAAIYIEPHRGVQASRKC